MSGELATPEELAARKARADAAARDSLSPREALMAAHDHLSDDEVATKIAANPGSLAEVLLALWRRIIGDEPAADEKPGSEHAGQGSFAPDDREAEVAALKARLAQLEEDAVKAAPVVANVVRDL